MPDELTDAQPGPMEHTPEPWTADIPYIYAGDTERNIAEVAGESSDEVWANARRIVACVNALAGWTTKGIETFADRHMPIKDAIDHCNKNHRAADERIRVLESALIAMIACHAPTLGPDSSEECSNVTRARAALKGDG